MDKLDTSQPATQTPDAQNFSAGQDGLLQPYAAALKDYFPSREAILQEAKSHVSRSRKVKKAVQGATLAAVLAAVIIADPILQQQTLTTQIGQRADYTLADGSRIILNTNSVVRAESHLRSRQIKLVQGEALFTVEHGWRPFTVDANRTHIRDIGTIFNVRNMTEGAIVTVLEGEVEVTVNRQTQRVTQHQTLQTSLGNMGDVVAANPEVAMAWQQGKLMFDGTPLAEAVRETQRYRAAPVIIGDAKAAKLRISGAYDIKGIESLIDTLPASVAVKVNRKADGAVEIRSAKPSRP